ncbi:MAG: GtrA family protein [Nocardioidaceae bacterium]|nr:GtrA family protein [Nocardioidaceae bacterium]
MMRSARAIVARLLDPEVLTFLAVGAAGYVVDVLAFNALRSQPALAHTDPAYAKMGAVAAAMVVTYVGNRALTWRETSSQNRHREVPLFVLFNLVGLGISVLTLLISHDLLGLTSRLADNISANVVGIALGTAFRYWSYKRFVFVPVPLARVEAITSSSDGAPPDDRNSHPGWPRRTSF